MDLHQLRLALLKVCVVAVAAVSWVFFSFVFESRPEADISGSDALSSLVRLPASLPAQLPEKIPGVFTPAPKVQEPIRMDVVRVPCWDQGEAKVSALGARWVRMTGRACQSEGGEISVRNLSNGYVATVFDSQGGQKTTDFIPLESGTNNILIRFDHGAGVLFENKVVLTR